MALGDAFLRTGSYAEAVTEYKRFLFFNPSDSRVAEVYSRIACCLLAAGRPGEAAAALRQAVASSVEAAERELELVRGLLGSGGDAEAELELLRLQAFSESDSPNRSLALCLAVLRVYQGCWAEAEEVLLSVFPEVGEGEPRQSAALRELHELLAEARRAKIRSPQAARMLSAVVPGTGQAYAGDPLDGRRPAAKGPVFGVSTRLICHRIIWYGGRKK